MKIFCLPLLLVLNLHLFSQAKTSFNLDAGEYSTMLSQLEQDLLKDSERQIVTLGNKRRNQFVRWIRDHVHVMQAMKYITADMTSFIEFYLENQTAEGLYFDYYYYLNERGVSERTKLFDKKYWKILPADSIQMHRLPVEADLEYLLVEGVYDVWQSTGDKAFVTKWLPSLVKGIDYSMTDPLRWSKKFQLVKRGYTLDTWDFMQLPVSREEYTRNGGDVQKGIFNIDENTPMGIMHGDNSGLYAACNQLSEMFKVTGNKEQSGEWKTKATGIRNRTNKLCWNGKFYAHFIADNPQPSYLKMDQRNTLSLSNPYDINRGLPTEDMAESIINTYENLKESNKSNSFAEWYGIYPPVQPHFADYKPGSYMNGGVNTIVAGELAKAAFQHGSEKYAVDILQRVMDLMKEHNGDLPVSYTPQRKVDEGIPDNWGQAAVYSALIEGLAGVVDKGSQFDSVEISPRWMAAGKDKAQVTVAYGATGKSISYSYFHNKEKKEIEIVVTDNYGNCTVRVLLPQNIKTGEATLNAAKVPLKIEQVNKSFYAVIPNATGQLMRISLAY